MYKIVIIDDDANELKKIRRTIKTNQPNDIRFEDKDYSVDEYKINDVDSEKIIVDKILEQIFDKEVALFVIDYKLLTNKCLLKGNNIFSKINEVVPEFPMVILTEKVEESLIGELVDSDKVYEKKKFFMLEDDYSKEKVASLFYNMKRYKNSLNALEDDLINLIKRIELEGANLDLVSRITEVESKMANLLPFQQISQAEKIYDASKLKEVVKLLSEAQNIIEDGGAKK